MLLYTRIHARSSGHLFGAKDGPGDESALLAAAKEAPEVSGPSEAPVTPLLSALT